MAKTKASTIYRATTARFRPALKSVDNVLDLAEKFLREKTNEVPNEMGDVRVLAILMLARAGIALRSAKVLFTHGHENDAMSVSRTIVELLIDLKYIRTDPKELAVLYSRYVHVANWRRYTQLQKFQMFAGKTPPLQVQRMKAKHDYFKPKYPKPQQWTKLSIAERAQKSRPLQMPGGEPVGAEMVYELMYRPGCDAIHSGPATLQDLFDGSVGSLSTHPRAPTSAFVLFMATFSFVYLFVEARETFGEVLADPNQELQTLLAGFLAHAKPPPTA